MSPAKEPTAQDWARAFREVPGALGGVLSALFAAVGGGDRTDMQAVYDMVWPRFSNDPFPVAVVPLLNPSLQDVADRACVDAGVLQAAVDGETEPSKDLMKAVAGACGVNPGFFVEYRVAVVRDLVVKVALRDPNNSVAAYRVLQQVARGSDKRMGKRASR